VASVRRHLFGSIYVVRAEKDGLAEHWAAATLQENTDATEYSPNAVKRHAGPHFVGQGVQCPMRQSAQRFQERGVRSNFNKVVG
jgi:hypothetical protein